MKHPKKSDIAWNTAFALIVALMSSSDYQEFALGWPIVTIAYTLIDGVLGKWE